VLARLDRFGAPVDYSAVYPWLQRVRALAAAIFLVTSLIAGFAAVPGSWYTLGLAALVVLHALLRSFSPHSPLETLLVDAVTIAIGLGLTEHAHTGLVAAAAYLIAASITFGGFVATGLVLSAFGAALLARSFLPFPSATEIAHAGGWIEWLSALTFLGGVMLCLGIAALEVLRSRQVQTQALHAERRAAEMKTEFVSMITHELRTPLTTIAGFAETLRDGWGDLGQSDIDEFLQLIVSESAHLQDLVEDVLTIPRLEAGRLLLETADFPLLPAAHKIVNLLFPEGGERSASVSVGSNVLVHADPNRVEQVLRNLVENARKYGGDTISVEAIPQGSEWQIVVADNGSGLPADARERIFEAFEQATGGDARTESGFGLGLTVARHLVDAMGGRIWYEPGFPVGARFCFTLPAAVSAPQAVEAA
jgi:signal transduction histidine kinase